MTLWKLRLYSLKRLSPFGQSHINNTGKYEKVKNKKNIKVTSSFRNVIIDYTNLSKLFITIVIHQSRKGKGTISFEYVLRFDMSFPYVNYHTINT